VSEGNQEKKLGDLSINLRNDIIFKVVFGYEKNEKILISLLNSILELENENKIVKLNFLNAFNVKEYLKDKLTSLDVKVTDASGQRYNVEMQVAEEKSYIKRIIYYLDKLYTSQLKESEPYEKLTKSISISIMNFVLLPEEEEFHNIYRYLNIFSKKELTDQKEIHFIELPKFYKDNPDNLVSKMEKWVYALKYGENYGDELDQIPENLKEEEIIMALREMVKAGNDDEIRELIEMKEKARHDEASRIYNAKAEGEKIGIAKGEQIGISKGKIEGKIEGKLEALQNKSIKLLIKKFGSLPTEIESKLRNCAEIEKLDQIIDNIFDLASVSEIESILG